MPAAAPQPKVGAALEPVKRPFSLEPQQVQPHALVKGAVHLSVDHADHHFTSGADHGPVQMAAVAAAMAPVPQAMVSPLPRSHTRILMVVGFTTRINSVLMRLGK